MSTQMPVHAVIDPWNNSNPLGRPGDSEGVDCREPGTCMLATDVSFQDVGTAVTAPISFDPATTEHRPAITVSDDGLIDRQVIRVEGQGFVRSERPLVRIYQCGMVVDPDLGERR